MKPSSNWSAPMISTAQSRDTVKVASSPLNQDALALERRVTVSVSQFTESYLTPT